MKVLTNNDFSKEVAQSKGVVLVDFYADWCGPCKMVAPVLEQLSEEIKEASIYKVNVDDSGELANQFKVMNIPTMIIFKDGNPVETMIGFQPKDALAAKLKAHL
ncbi:MAG: thioredoxin [Clostridium sp.]